MIRLGIATRYCCCEETYVALRLAQWGRLNGHEISFLTTTKRPVEVVRRWDAKVLCAAEVPWEDWVSEQDVIVWTGMPQMQQLRTAQQRNCHTAAVCLWHNLRATVREIYRCVKQVIVPHRAVSVFLRSRWSLSRSVVVPWDAGLPLTRKTPTGQLDDCCRLLLPLFDDEAQRVEATALEVLERALLRTPSAQLTVAYNSAALAPFVQRRLSTFCRMFPGRITILRGVMPSRRPLVYQQADLTIWPSCWENTGLTGLTSLAMGTPVLAFAFPPLTEFLGQTNAVLAACRTGAAGQSGAPTARPDYDSFESVLCELLAEPARLAALQQTTSDGLAARRKVFDMSLAGALQLPATIKRSIG